MQSSRRGMRSPGHGGKIRLPPKVRDGAKAGPLQKKSKKENVEKYFDDVPKKKTKVSRLWVYG